MLRNQHTKWQYKKYVCFIKIIYKAYLYFGKRDFTHIYQKGVRNELCVGSGFDAEW